MIKLPAELLINNVASLHKNFVTTLQAGDEINLDMNDVIQADTASVQLLCALQKHLLTTEHKIQWHGNSPALISAANKLGVSDFLAIE